MTSTIIAMGGTAYRTYRKFVVVRSLYKFILQSIIIRLDFTIAYYVVCVLYVCVIVCGVDSIFSY